MIKILVVITTGFAKYGGLTNAFMNYFRFMDKEGIIIDIASMNEPDEELREELEATGGNYYKLPDKRKNTIKYLWTYKKLCNNYDVVHIHGNSPTMAAELYIAKKCRIKTRIAHCHNSQGMHPFMNFFCYPAFWNSYTCGLSVSKAAGDWIYKKHPYGVLYNAIDLDKYKYDESARILIRGKYGIKENEFVIGHVGKINSQKNHSFLLDVFARVIRRNPQSKLLLVGDGILREEIENKAKELEIHRRVIFAGMQKDSSKLYSAMDMFMFPSIYEGFSLALLEAQANGLLCIASTAVTEESNKSGNVIYSPFEVEAWVDEFEKHQFEYSLDKRERRCTMAREKIRENGFDIKKSAERLRQIYLNGEI